MFRDLVLKNRSCRGYDESYQFSREELLDFVDLARQTAASANIQPLKYHIAYEKEQVAQIQPLTRWAGSLPQLHLPYPGTGPTAFITICQDMSINNHPTSFLLDVGITAQTILLAATEKGLGGCMIGSFQKEELKALLKLPEQMEPKLVIALGKPAEEIILVEPKEDGSVKYYRSEDGKTHYVPKRKLEDIIL
ncbi:MAG: nitroreductase family protein [Oscillospiraceae bacterium]|nr:nitroreductase family protein [Oscillospiraceae bacterium]